MSGSPLATAALILFSMLNAALSIEVSDIEELKDAMSHSLITLKNLHVPGGVTLELKPQPGTVIEFAGKTTFGYEEWKGPLIRVKGTNLEIKGVPGHLIDCEGQRWWDTLGGNGGKIKPKFFRISVNNSVIHDLTVKNTPVHAFAINGSVNVTVSNIKLDNSEGDALGGHNTDAFDVNADQVRIFNCTVNNQDDCFAMNSGSDVVFENNVCVGGHGISIGSVGGWPKNTVQRVTIRHCEVINSTNGIRIKTKLNRTGSVENVTFEDVLLTNITKYGIVIQGNYANLGSRGEPTPGVPITGLKVTNVRGTVLKKGANIFVWVKNASNWQWDSDVRGGGRQLTCQGIPPNVNIPCGEPLT